MSQKHDPPLILIVDDQMQTVTMLERVFEFEGYQVQSVYDGESALKAARDLHPDLILLDVMMPGMSGFDVLRELRADPKIQTIPTILVTAMGEPSNVIQGLELGADDYLRKPFQTQELIARAQSKMRARELEERLQRRTQELEALLRVSEELSQHLEMDELLDFVLYLALDLLPCEVAAIYRINNYQVIDQRVRRKDGTITAIDLDLDFLTNWITNQLETHLWPENHPLPDGFFDGVIVPMHHGDDVNGVIVILNDAAYDLNHVQLFAGIGRQAALAMRNVELYEIQADYAQHLEDMVAERTAELESAQHMLVRSEKLASIGRLAASIAHEIKNPLFPIQINLDDMLEDVKADHPISVEDVERTLESVQRIRHIVEHLLEFTGNQHAGTASFNQVQMNGVIEGIIDLNRKSFQQQNIELITNLGDLPPIQGNKYQLEQVIMNLILNAKDAIDGSEGVVEIISTADDEHILVKVTDDGAGIPPEMIENIFEPFVSSKENGNGLGLFISYGIIQNHRGTIEVESEVNEGTQFTLRLPISRVKESLQE
jgi:two-component system, NtrC family, sensor kinase